MAATPFRMCYVDQNHSLYYHGVHLDQLEPAPWLHKALQRIMIAFLWTGTNVLQAGKCLASWKQVQRPLQLEGLGVLDLKLFSIALRCRWLWLQHMAPDCTRSSLQTSKDSLTTAFFYSSVQFNLGDGETFLF
jgi:hypothetical protein